MWPRVEGAVPVQEDGRRAGAAERTRREKEIVVEDKAIDSTGTPDTPATKPTEDTRISIDEFMRVDLRVATVLEAEAVPKSKKLLKLKVDTGSDQRTIVAGIAEVYQPEQLVGRTLVIVANLRPATLMGIESQGMVLAASLEGKPTLVGVEAPVPPGTRVR